VGELVTFGATSTAAEVVAGVDLSGRSAVVTGAASGIGVETARALALTGADVTLAVRDVAAGDRVAADITATTGNRGVRVAALDLADLASVDAFTAAWRGPLHVLVANAGVMASPEAYTDHGWESQFAVNHLGHFALAVGLHGALAAAGSARVVSVSSSGHSASPVVFDDLFFDRRPYDPMLAYGQSKTANVLFAVAASKRWAADGVTANAVMPGGIWTGLQRHWDPEVLAATKADAAARLALKTPEQGAATSVLVATSAALAGVGGRYFEDCHEAAVVPEVVDGLHGVRGYALDAVAAERLWDVSLALLAAAR
jgi:NAD(P)-dependent dehydrogenase (short-subunit alcohol dehydrogenase family)